MPRLIDPCDHKPNSEVLLRRAREAITTWAKAASSADIGWMYNQIAYRELRKKRESSAKPQKSHNHKRSRSDDRP